VQSLNGDSGQPTDQTQITTIVPCAGCILAIEFWVMIQIRNWKVGFNDFRERFSFRTQSRGDFTVS
jgi:hypothetical protein